VTDLFQKPLIIAAFFCRKKTCPALACLQTTTEFAKKIKTAATLKEQQTGEDIAHTHPVIP
jgi:hypothetical protein